MKKYVIKKDFPGSRIGDVWVEENNGFMSPSGRDGIKMHKPLFTPFHDWFDKYGEPKEYWFINDLDGEPMKCESRYCQPRHFTEWAEKRKQIGNYFETKEEAEKAVEKLKAYKRLKDKGFRFSEFVYTELCDYARVNIRATMINDSINEDLMLLFGGEE